MSRIQTLSKQEIVSNAQKKILYFSNTDNEQPDSVKDIILSAINSASETICIASTAELHDDLGKALIGKISQNSNLRVYGLFQDFNKSARSIGFFGKDYPVLCRSSRSLKNNFILIDGKIGFVFFKSLNNIENVLCLPVKEELVKDLFYWFCQIFWEKADKEFLLGKISEPREAPFSIPEFQQKNINWTVKKPSYQQAYYPRDICFKQNILQDIEQQMPCQLSDNLDTEPLFLNENSFTQGNLEFHFNLKEILSNSLGSWTVRQTALSDAPDTFIDIESSHWDIKQKQHSVEKNLPEIQAQTIEEMKGLKPEASSLSPEPYSEETIFHYMVKPPIRSKHSEKADIYKQFEKLEKDYSNNLKRFNDQIDNLEKKAKDISAVGILQSLKEMQQELKTEKSKDFNKMDRGTLRSIIQNWSQDESGWIHQIEKLNLDYSKEKFIKEKSTAIEQLNSERHQKESDRNSCTQEIFNLEKSISDQKVNRDSIQTKLEEAKSEEKPQEDLSQKLASISKEIRDLESQLEGKKKKDSSLQKEISSLNDRIKAKEAEHFQLKQENELEAIKKSSNKTAQQYSKLKIPDFLLPEVGELYEDKESFYLEISDYEDLEKANELGQRYNTKKFKVVAKKES